MLFEEKFIYFPTRFPDGDWHRANYPDTAIEPYPRVEDVWLTASDGVKLHGWYCTPTRAAGPVQTDVALLYLHGNAGNVSHRYDQLHLLMFLGAAIFILDYRGYGRSKGKPTEQGLYRDGLAAWQYLVEQRGLPPRRVVLLGKSLGGAVAIELATRDGVHPAGLILQSTFTSLPDMAAIAMPIVPRRLVRTSMNNLEKIAAVRCPALFIHSPQDEVVPYAMTEKLYDAARAPKRLYRVDGAGHNDVTVVGGKTYLRTVDQFIRECVKRNAT